MKSHKSSTHSAHSDNFYFHVFYWLSDWVEIVWGFTRFFFKQMLVISAFYLEKQKKFYSLKKLSQEWTRFNIKTTSFAYWPNFQWRFWLLRKQEVTHNVSTYNTNVRKTSVVMEFWRQESTENNIFLLKSTFFISSDGFTNFYATNLQFFQRNFLCYVCYFGGRNFDCNQKIHNKLPYNTSF